MRVSVTVTKELEDFWATEEQFASMSDAQVIELIQEDVTALLEGASWTVTRE
jgi:hypothetical protein